MSKGGMAKNPFGGATRLDTIDFMDFAGGSDSPIKMLYIKVISDAASDYLFFGLGKNGTVADDFWYATEYFFNVRSYRKETWEHAKFMRHAYFDETSKKRVSTSIMLTDEELKMACFDRHYELAELDRQMPFEMFLVWLKQRREELLLENMAQVNDYIDLLQQTALKEVEGGQQIQHRFNAIDRFQVLCRPDSPEQIAELVYYKPRYRRPTIRRGHAVRAHREMSSKVRSPRSLVAQPGQALFEMAA